MNSKKDKVDRVSRLEQQVAPPRDPKRAKLFNLLRNFAAAHPEMHSASATPGSRAATEHKAAEILAAEMARRLDSGRINDPGITRALRGVQQFNVGDAEDWE